TRCGPAAPAGRGDAALRRGRRTAEVLGAQPRAAPAGAGDLRPGGGHQPARTAERPAGTPPVPAVAAPWAPAGLAPRPPGDHRRRGRTPADRSGGRHPPPPEQRHLRAARPAADPVPGGTVPGGTVPGGTVPGGGQVSQQESMLVVSAHAADFVWRAGGAVALAALRGDRVTVLCLSYGERGESASAWRAGKTLEEIKAQRRGEAESAAAALGAAIEFLDAG